MNKICIVLSSLYQPGTPEIFNEEVQQDLLTIRETLSDHLIVNITIPVNNGNHSCKRLIWKGLATIEINRLSCVHIVLNTHGVPGASDLSRQAVILLVEMISKLDGRITQISGLQCNGMEDSFRGQANAITMSDNMCKLKFKDADLVTLQNKLNALTLHRPQLFKIRGFEYEYLPTESQREVINLLKGEGGEELTVNIPGRSFDETFYQIVLTNVEKVKNRKALSDLEYQQIANFFATLQNEMIEAILLAVQKNELISENSPLWSLWSALVEYDSHNKMSQFQSNNPQRIKQCYKLWLKDFKLYSEQRLNVFIKFARSSLEQVPSSEESMVESS